MKYIPSPVPLKYDYIFTALANRSGRMQYYKIKPGYSKIRVSRGEYIKAFNDSSILAIKPLQQKGDEQVFQFEFYV